MSNPDPTPDRMSDEELLSEFAEYSNHLGYHTRTSEEYEAIEAEILRRMDPKRRARLEAIEKAVKLYMNSNTVGQINSAFEGLRAACEMKSEPQNNPASEHTPAEASSKDWYPNEDPITGFPFFVEIDHPTRGRVPTYGGPFDSYTLCERDDQGEFFRERYDHDAGWWVDEFEAVPLRVVDEEDYDDVLEFKKNIVKKPVNTPAEIEAMRESAERLAIWLRAKEHDYQETDDILHDEEELLFSEYGSFTCTAGDIRKVIELCRIQAK